ncbi:c-type cytochrome [Helicobacter turcicus]|uniref:C-type cytochrome n=1 Tax=Helicobacter turcicus TaxID=2867412 RepID=A0ABS7JP73_9HELI|nr:c-type cytochrome [Helicobacter turcicus]MBX7491177.1 c-type cytochrome [Helicobacter turcicus]MBX7546044.1 c-type cytochrome [Helicobacter turcicus]
MKKLLSTLTCILTLSGTLYAGECICFELKGEFGEEIKAIMKKYSKNLGGDNIKVVREDADLTPQERSFLSSMLGTGEVSESKRGANLENGKKLYNRDCAGCHGQKGEISVASQKPINTWKAADIANEIKTYANQTFEGQSRFVKNQIAQRYTKRDMDEVGAYIESLR